MFQSRAKCLIIALFIFGCYTVSAQTQASSGTNSSNPLSERENDPYSKYGIGEFWNGNNTVLRGMGNVTSAFENPYEVNSDNPASYSFLQRTTYEAGFMGSTRSVVGSGSSYKTGTASLAYLNIGIPVSKHSGLCFGFKPYTRSYYTLVDTINNSPIGRVKRSYAGNGALSYAYLGGAINYKGLSLGVNVGYMFGTLTSVTATVPIDSNVINRAYSTEFANYDRMGGIYWKTGALYERKIDSDYTIRIGATFTLQQNVTERLNAFQISTFDFHDTVVNDTSSYVGQQTGKLTLPMSYSIGAMLVKNDKWSLGIDYAVTQWSGFNSTPDNTLTFNVGKQSYRAAVGGEYTPDVNNIRNYYSRITFRAGAYYGTNYLNINNLSLPEYGVTLGCSLPFKRSLSKLHTAVDIGRLGTTANGLIQETYVRFTLGFSFNDKWFIPRKYE
jgi:hypothetical protein